jgi:hypothetical protein
MSQKPELSVVIVVVSSVFHLEGCLRALSQQKEAPKMQIIVPYDCSDGQMDSLKSEYSQVQFCRVSDYSLNKDSSKFHHERIDRLRSLGMKQAEGDLVALLEDHDKPHELWSRRIIEEHRKYPFAAIGGAIENSIDRKLNWAVYFCDFGKYQNPLKDGPSSYLSDVNVSYKRQALDSIKEIWKDFYHEPDVHNALIAKGETLWLSPKIIVYQNREKLRLAAAIKERYLWGRYYSGFRVQKFGLVKRLLYTGLSPLIPFILSAKKIRDILKKKRNTRAFVCAFPVTLLMLFIWSIGEFVGYLTARPT